MEELKAGEGHPYALSRLLRDEGHVALKVGADLFRGATIVVEVKSCAAYHDLTRPWYHIDGALGLGRYGGIIGGLGYALHFGSPTLTCGVGSDEDEGQRSISSRGVEDMTGEITTSEYIELGGIGLGVGDLIIFVAPFALDELLLPLVDIEGGLLEVKLREVDLDSLPILGSEGDGGDAQRVGILSWPA